MNTQQTPESLATMPVVTVEQITRFREAALRVEQQRDELVAASKRALASMNDAIIQAPSDCVPVFDGIADLHDAITKAQGAQQ